MNGYVQHPSLLLSGFLVLALNLCCMGTPDEEQSQTSGGFLPHPADWAQVGRHGQQYLADRASCQTSCHGDDLGGGFTSIACTQCHGVYPHPDGWIQPTVHGEASRQDDALAECAACHGEDFEGGVVGVGCRACHPLYPHVQGWIQPSSHGLTVIQAGGPVACATSCHGADFQGGLTSVSCFTCHPLYPHGPSWTLFDQHGAAAKPDASQNCATLCHGRGFSGGDSGVSCFECHSAYPHIDWSPFEEHVSWVRTFGDTSCITSQGCHNDSRGPGFGQPVDCTSFCHLP